jgi:hypothetical protein
MLNTEQATIQARAQMTWGDSHQSIIEFLQSNGFGDKEAFDLVRNLQKERNLEIRALGLRKIYIGISLILIPIVYLIISGFLGFIFVKLFFLLLIPAAIGVAKVFSGIRILFLPSSERRDFSSIAE